MNKTKRALKAFAMMMVCVLCIFCFSQNTQYLLEPQAATSLSDLQAQQKKIKAQKDKLAKQIKNAKNGIEGEKQKQKDIESQIAVIEEGLRVTEDKIALLSTQITEQQAKIDAQKADIDKNISQFKSRIRTMFIAGDGQMASVLVGSTDFYDFLTRTELEKRVSQHDDKMITDLNAMLEEYNVAKAQLDAAKAEADADKAQLDKDKAARDAAYSSSTAEQKALEKEFEDYQKNKAEIDKQDAKIEAAIQDEIARLAKMNTYVGGEYTWPTPGYTHLTSPFGMRTFRGVTKGHKGVDISGSGINGKPIVAANSGKVIVANNNYTRGVSYGRYVMIDHGGGRVTLYGHCSSLNVSAGQMVNKGDVIAAVGSTGDSTGPHLHFEVRINGQAVNPMQYFK
ncbi:MAG: peptidoglycan DD-metalloendopeptidase family protein [Oscillospiraceae bacterium]